MCYTTYSNNGTIKVIPVPKLNSLTRKATDYIKVGNIFVKIIISDPRYINSQLWVINALLNVSTQIQVQIKASNTDGSGSGFLKSGSAKNLNPSRSKTRRTIPIDTGNPKNA